MLGHSESLQNMELETLLRLIKQLHETIRDGVVAACERSATTSLAAVAREEEGDTIYAVDRISEDLLVDFFSVDGDVLGSFDTQPNLFSANFEDDHFDSISDHDALRDFSCEHQHVFVALRGLNAYASARIGSW